MSEVRKKPYYLIKVQAGESYAWCACALTRTPPFCDGSHKNANGIKPVVIKAEESKELFFCGCRETKNRPFCDGSHKTLNNPPS